MGELTAPKHLSYMDLRGREAARKGKEGSLVVLWRFISSFLTLTLGNGLGEWKTCPAVLSSFGETL